MSKINIKIVEVDQSTHSVIVKYASEHSKKTIDEYPAIAFQVTNFSASTPEEFIEAIRPQISIYVQQRDQQENPADYIDLSSWNGFTAEVNAVELPTLAPPPIDALANPEVVL
jgi:hypothetical protein